MQALSSSKSLAERRDQLELLLGIEHLRVRRRPRRARRPRAEGTGRRRSARRRPTSTQLRAEVERCEREAQQAAPAELEAKVTVLKAQAQAAVGRIEALTKQISEHGSRRLSAEQAAGELAREQTVLDNLRQRLDAAAAAQVELAELAPVAARADEVTALEREMDMRRRNHEQFESLRAKERTALEDLAAATDALAQLGDAPVPEEDPVARFSAAQDELNRLGEQLRDAAEARQRADDAARVAAEGLAQVKARDQALRELKSLAESEAAVERSRGRWQELRDERADVQAQLNHDIKHRDALTGVGDTDAGVCPTCKRPLEGTLGDLLAEFEAIISSRQAQLDQIGAEMEQLVAIGKQHKAAVDRAQQVRAQLASLIEVGDRPGLEFDAEETAAAARGAANREHEIGTAYRALSEQMPTLRSAADQAADLAQRRAEAYERKQRAGHLAAEYAEQRGQIGSNGYDTEAHVALKADLERTQKAVRRTAALRENADAVQLLEGRIAKQQPLVDELTKKVAQLREHAAEVEPGPDAHQTAVAEHRRLSDELEEARRALDAAKQQASMEDQAVNAARTRLEVGRKMLRRIARERRELELQTAVATALADYREHASQRARPDLHREASHLLKQVTGSTYPLIRLTENYLLEVADGDRFHPLKRFSGGEQDLAALCLRLALSRTLARQRGAEQGFVILDEIFGSQDVERRKLVMAQLRELAEAEFQQIFVISHIDDVREHCRLHIHIRRENGVSVAEGPTI